MASISNEDVRAVVKAAIAGERERCAKIAEGFSARQSCGGHGGRDDNDKNYREIAAAIRNPQTKT